MAEYFILNKLNIILKMFLFSFGYTDLTFTYIQAYKLLHLCYDCHSS